VTDESFDRSFWERRWAEALGASPEKLAGRPPNAYLLAAAGDLRPGRALDAGCGQGSEAIWLAGSGWRVTAVDFSTTALDHGRSTAAAVGPDVAGRITWVEGDLGSWAPEPGRFDLVSCLYVHVAGSVVELVRRLAAGVAPGGSLLLVGHRPIDPETGAPTPASTRWSRRCVAGRRTAPWNRSDESVASAWSSPANLTHGARRARWARS
jgi:SAM-dependent methyltransferase